MKRYVDPYRVPPLAYFLRPSGSLKADITRGLYWLLQTAPKYTNPDQPPLVVVNDVRFFDGHIQPLLGRSWEDVRKVGNRVTISDTSVQFGTERTIAHGWHNVVVMINPTDMLIRRVEDELQYVREILLITDGLERHKQWLSTSNASEIDIPEVSLVNDLSRK